jgi:hypothetical protein
VEEFGIGSLSKLRWIVGVLIALRIEDGEQWWGLPTVSRDGGGDRAAGGDRSREIGRERKGANARTCTREAREGTRGPEEAVPMLKQVLVPRRRVWQPQWSSGRSSATWRPHEQASTGSGRRQHS